MEQSIIIPDKALALNGVLLRYLLDRQKEGLFVLPSDLSFGRRAEQIGGGAVCLTPEMSKNPGSKQLRVESGYTVLKPNCFDIRYLSTLYLPETIEQVPAAGNLNTNSWATMHRNLPDALFDRIVLKRRFDRDFQSLLISRALPYGDAKKRERYLLTDAFVRDPSQKVLEGLAAAVASLPDLTQDMRYIMRLPDRSYYAERDKFWNELSTALSLGEEIDCYDLSLQCGKISEIEAVNRMIRDGFTGWRDAKAEHENDISLRQGKTVPKRFGSMRWYGCGVTAVTVDHASVTKQNGLELVDVCFDRCVLFTPALRRVRLGGRDYYIYSRNFLTGEKECPYIRCDMCVIEKGRVVTDRETVTEVYAKYKLLSIL